MNIRDATRPEADPLLQDIADYVLNYREASEESRVTAGHCLLDTLACALMALKFPACAKLLGPLVPGAEMPNGAPVPGTAYRLDPVAAAFNIGAMARWLDFNDTWLAAEWGHPSDNLGGLLASADYQSRQNLTEGKKPLVVGELLEAMIQAYEIQGVLALENSFNGIGLDHVLLVRVASAAATTRILGGNREQIINAVSNAWLDGGALRTYRHAPNTGSRKSWAAGDATSRALRLALMALTSEMGYPAALSAPRWGFQDVLLGGEEIRVNRPFACYVMENILFKISFPAEFHGQTAVEAALALHGQAKDRLHEIAKIVIETQQAGARIIDKTGPLDNPADRDHCLQYMTAIGLIFGRLEAADYEDEAAADPRIDPLRRKMVVAENEEFTAAYHDPDRRAIGNAVQIFFDDGSKTDRVAIEYPIGHRRRRGEGIPLLLDKFQNAVREHFAAAQADAILAACEDREALAKMPVNEFLELWSQ